MSPTEPRRRRTLNLHCSVCDRSYTKKEHLQRHERSHTGAKPFTCHVCGRTFSRQDVLNRHTRVHERSGSLVAPVAQADASMLLDPNLNTPYQITPGDTVISPITANNGFRQPEIAGVPLFWPDSEDLLQNIMSIDPALWEQPMTLMPSALASHASPDLIFDYANFNTDGDEGHRAIQTLSAQLSNTFTGVTAPAALAGLTSRFLDSCLHMFFSTFIPMLPVIHRPTFVFRDCSPPLLLNAIAIGSLFLGTKEATIKGDALWRLAHTAVATSWHSMINHRGEYDAAPGLQLVQTSLLSQVYAALAKSRTLRMTSQVFHGLGIYWARHCGLYDLMQIPALPSMDDSAEIKHQAWRVWLARETRLRSLLGLYILDGVISQYSGSPTFTQHMSNQLPMPSDELSFSASNPDDWLQRTAQRVATSNPVRFCDIFRAFFYPKNDGASVIPPGLTFLSLKVILEGLKSLVAESKRIEPPPVGVPSQADINLVLDRVRQYIHNSPSLSVVEKRVAILRWHAICLDALLVTARGARRLCFGHGIVQHIFGGGERFETDINPKRHVEKDEARRTLLHAREIQHIASQLPLGHAHDAHVPGAVFAAATTYAAFALAGKTRIQFPGTVDWCVAVLLPRPDAGHLDPIWDTDNLTGASAATAAFIRSTIDAPDLPDNAPIIDLSYELSSIRLLLRGLSLQWGVCSEMEAVVDAWIGKCS